MDIRPVKDEDSYAWALREIEGYFEHEPAPGTPEADRFDVLAALIGSYEATAHPIKPAEPLEVIRLVMEQRGTTQGDLAEVLDSRSRASEVLAGRRELSKGQIAALSKAWRIPAGLLIGGVVHA